MNDAFCAALIKIIFLTGSAMAKKILKLVEVNGFEPMTPCVQGRCSPN